MGEKDIIITSDVLQQLASLQEEPKFFAAETELYPGAPSEEIRERTERAVNQMVGRLRTNLCNSPKKSYVLSEFQRMLKVFEHEDSEEKERACDYCERVMKILGIERSDGLLNTWLYGFDPDKPRR